MTADPSGQFGLIESLRYAPQEGYFLLERHLRRLARSAEELGFSFARFDAYSKLAAFAQQLRSAHKVRLELARDGQLELTASPLQAQASVELPLASRAVDSSDWTLAHKTTCRQVYDAALAASPGATDVILHNERGELTETCIGNLVLAIDGVLLTPALDSGLLPGTFRDHLIACGVLREARIPVDALQRATRVHRINSVRLWTPVTLA